MIENEKKPDFVYYFVDCKNGEHCLYNIKNKCTYSHHAIQKRVFQYNINGLSLEKNAPQNALLHLSILLNISREEIIEITDIDLKELFEIPNNSSNSIKYNIP